MREGLAASAHERRSSVCLEWPIKEQHLPGRAAPFVLAVTWHLFTANTNEGGSDGLLENCRDSL